MSGTKRTPIGRPPRPIISERASKLFKQGIALLHNGGDRDGAEMRWISVALHRQPRHHERACISHPVTTMPPVSKSAVVELLRGCLVSRDP